MGETNWGSSCDECGGNLEEMNDLESNLQNGNFNEINNIISCLLKKVYLAGYKQGCHDAPFCCRKR